MKIALIGYGKMGREVEACALKRGYTLVGKFNSPAWKAGDIQNADVCLDFTHATSIVENLKKIIEVKKPVVIGTTGWNSNKEEVKNIISQGGIGALYGANFSIGIYLFQNIIRHVSSLLNMFPEYDVAGFEHHHKHKADAPSGTARELAHEIETHMPRIDKVPFTSVRCGTMAGTHTLLFDSPADTISLTHHAHSREGFASGAILAAEWIRNKTGLFTFEDCMKEWIQKRNYGA